MKPEPMKELETMIIHKGIPYSETVESVDKVVRFAREEKIRSAIEWLYYWVYCLKCQDRCDNRKHYPHWVVDWDNVEKAFEGVIKNG